MSLAIGFLLDDIRNTYLSLVRTRISDACNSQRRVIVEPSLRNSSGELVCEGHFDLPMRVDMYFLNSDSIGNSAHVDSPLLPEFAPFPVHWNSQMTVTIAPFCWDSCDFLLRKSISQDDVKEIVAWFMDCFDPDDLNSADEDGLQGVVHFLSDPEISESSTFFQIDFGSASIDAFTRLLDIISSLGVSEVSVGQVNFLS